MGGHKSSFVGVISTRSYLDSFYVLREQKDLLASKEGK